MDSVERPLASAWVVNSSAQGRKESPTQTRGQSDSAPRILTVHELAGILLTAATYYVGGRCDALLSSNSTSSALICPPNAVLLTALLLVPMRRWWIYVLAVLPMDFALSHRGGATLPISAGLFFSNTLQSLSAAWLLRQAAGQRVNWASFRAVLLFLLFGVVTGPAIGAVPGGLTVGHFHGSGVLWRDWRGWFVANSLNNLVLVPVLSAIASGRALAALRLAPRRAVEAALLLGGLVATCIEVFARRPPGPESLPALVYIPLPFLLWAALRLGAGGASAASLVITVVATLGAAHSRGPFALDSPAGNPLSIQLFLLAICTPFLPFAALVKERERTLAELKEKFRLESALREGERRFRAVYDEAAIGIAIVDPAGHPIETNRALQEMLGYSARELRQITFPDFTHPDDVKTDWELFTELMAGKRSHYQIEKRYFRKDGSELSGRLTVSVLKDAAGKPQYAVGMVEDITQRTLAERARQESEDRLRTMAEGIPVLVWMSDQSRGCTWFNQHWLNFVGQSLDEEIGDGWTRHIHPDDFDHCLKVYATAFDAREPFEMEYRLRRGDGEFRWILDSGVPRFDRTGQFIGYVGGCIDISGRKRAEDARRDRETRLRLSIAQVRDLAGRLLTAQEEERRHLARELHDDLSQRLAALSIGLSAVKSRVPEAQRAEMSRLQDDALGVANDIRSLSHQLHPSVLQHVGLAAALKARCAELRDQGTLDVAFRVHGELGEVKPEISLCVYRVSQEALSNIVRHAEAHHAQVSLGRENGWLELIIRDDGHGFDPAEARSAGGLGLTSLEERVRFAKGTLMIQSRPGLGTELRARIPLGGSDDSPESAAGG